MKRTGRIWTTAAIIIAVAALARPGWSDEGDAPYLLLRAGPLKVPQPVARSKGDAQALHIAGLPAHYRGSVDMHEPRQGQSLGFQRKLRLSERYCYQTPNWVTTTSIGADKARVGLLRGPSSHVRCESTSGTNIPAPRKAMRAVQVFVCLTHRNRG